MRAGSPPGRVFDADHGPEPDRWDLLALAQRTLFDDTPVGVAILDDQLRYVRVNRVLADIHQLSVDDHVGRPIDEVVPDLAWAVREPCLRVLRTGRPLHSLDIPGIGGGDSRHWSGSVYPVRSPDGTPVGVVALVKEVTAAHRSVAEAAARRGAEEQARRLAMLQRLTAALAEAVDTAQVADVVVSTVTETLGADSGTICLIGTDHRCRVLASTGLPERVAAAWRDFPILEGNPTAEAIGTRRPVLIPSRAERDRRYPALRGVDASHEAWAILPLLGDGGPFGLVTFGWRRPLAFSADDVDLLGAVAGQAANAMERARLFDTERVARTVAERAERRLALLAGASERLTAVVSEAQQLADLADLLVDGFADWCTVFMPDESGRLCRRVVRSVLAGTGGPAEALVDSRFEPASVDDPRAVAWQTGRVSTVVVTDIGPYLGVIPATAGPAVPVPISILAAPIVARGEVLGVFNVWRGRDKPPFDAEDEQLLADIGRRAGAAVDNARLLAARTRVAARLQDTLLPGRLPTVDGVEMATRYLVAEDAADVGGDLYDAFDVGKGGFALVIGDVTGRGVAAAGLTGLARATLRALAGQLSPPAALARLNTLLAERTGGERFLTVAYLLLRPDADGASVRVWLAGHPPPVLVRAGGEVVELGTPGPLLGVLPEVRYAERRYRLSRGDLLVLYTDGLVEARGAGGLFGEARLPGILPELAGRTATEVVARLEQAVTDYRTSGADDVALLAVRLTPPTEPTERVLLDRRIAAEPPAISLARHAAAAVLGPVLPAERLYETVVAVSELLTNAVQQLAGQPSRSPRPDPVRLRVVMRGGTVRIEVSNPGPRFVLPEPTRDPAVAGRGLRLVRAVATDLGVTTSSGDTCVWFCVAGRGSAGVIPE